jgi:hypothetical protein
MQCDVCKKQQSWLEVIGKNIVCHDCLRQNKDMALVLRTHKDTFAFLLRKMTIKSFEEYLKITRKDIEKLADLKRAGIKFKTTNVVTLE